MKEFQIVRQNEGMKLMRFLNKVLPNATDPFIYKMLRKKNITLNEKKASGNERLSIDDKIKIYFSDETFEIFSGVSDKKNNADMLNIPDISEDIIFENDDIILINKKSGILSQRASSGDISMVELIQAYLKAQGTFKDDISGFSPAVANRLDRNTSGIIAAGKTLKGLKYLSDGFKQKYFDKYYLCPVAGVIKEPRLFNGLWSKDSHGNRVRIFDIGWEPEMGREFPYKYRKAGNIPAQTAVYPISHTDDYTLLKVELLTGKSHQIRAQLSNAGFPLIGDHKYGIRRINDIFKRRYGIESQMLHAYSLNMSELGMFFADLPQDWKMILEKEGLWVHGIREVFEDQHLRI